MYHMGTAERQIQIGRSEEIDDGQLFGKPFRDAIHRRRPTDRQQFAPAFGGAVGRLDQARRLAPFPTLPR